MPFTAMAHGCLNARKLLDVLAHTVKMNYYFFLSRYANQYKLACKHLMILVHGEVLYVPPKIKWPCSFHLIITTSHPLVNFRGLVPPITISSTPWPTEETTLVTKKKGTDLPPKVNIAFFFPTGECRSWPILPTRKVTVLWYHTKVEVLRVVLELVVILRQILYLQFHTVLRKNYPTLLRPPQLLVKRIVLQLRRPRPLRILDHHVHRLGVGIPPPLSNSGGISRVNLITIITHSNNIPHIISN